MAVIKKIHGFIRADQSYSSQGEQFRLTETCLVEAYSPLSRVSDVVFELPNTASGPGALDWNPDQLTFTLKISLHPESDQFRLDSLEGMKRKDPDSNFWLIPLVYMTPPVNLDLAQQVDKPKAKKKKNRTRITDPVNRPPVFSMSINTQSGTTFTDRYQRRIVHRNRMPIEQPLPQYTDAWQFNWSWNIAIANLPGFLDDAALFTNGTNKEKVSIKDSDRKHIMWCEKRTLRGSGVKLSEVFETPSGSSVEHHYARVGFTMTYTPSRMIDEPQISQHTLQLLQNTETIKKELAPIPINAAGGKAKKPWPLQVGGAAVPWEEVAERDLSNAANLWCVFTEDSLVQEHSDDVEINEWIPAAQWHAFMNFHKLHLPGKRE